MVTTAEILGDFAAGLHLEDVPERVLRKARHQTMAILGALYAGQSSPDAMAVRTVVAGRAVPHGRVPIVPGRDLRAASAEDSLLAASAATMAHDFDDYVFAGHTGHTAVLVPLLLGAELGSDGREALTAQVIANEVAARIGAAVAIGPHNGQMWAPIHAVGAACAAGRLLGLDATSIADAIAIALYSPPFPLMPGFMGSGSKLLTAALPAWMGLGAARLAAAGMRGARGIIEEAHGFLHHFSYAPARSFFGGLGRAWLTDTIAYKVYPGCAYIGSAIDALLELSKRNGLVAADVDSVDVHASIVTTAMQRLAEAHAPKGRLTAVNINFSIPFNVALTLIHGRLDTRGLGPRALDEHEDTLRDLASRVKVRHDWELTARLATALERSLHLRHLLPEIRPAGLLRARRELLGASTLSPSSAAELASIGRALRWMLRGAKRSAGRSSRPGSTGGDRPAARYDLARADLESFTFPFGARVVVRTRAGRQLEATVETPRGTPGPWEESFRWTEEKLCREALALERGCDPEHLLQLLRSYERHSPGEVLDAI